MYFYKLIENVAFETLWSLQRKAKKELNFKTYILNFKVNSSFNLYLS